MANVPQSRWILDVAAEVRIRQQATHLNIKYISIYSEDGDDE